MCAEKKMGCHCFDGTPQIKGFLIPCLLMLLNKNSSHGYQLIESLKELGFYKNLPDPGVIYRHLRKLEKNEMVASSLEEGGGGPARKVYSITEVGQECLKNWSEGLKELRGSIDGLLNSI